MSKGRLRVGFLATQYEESYQHAVFQGAVEEGERSSLQLVFFEGSNAETQRKAGALDETAFSLASLARLDGLIIMTNTMGSSYDTQRIAGYLARFSDIPMVSIGVEFPGIYALKANTQGGIRSEVAHLIKVHDRHAFLFLAGPKHHPESEQREKEFLDTVAELSPTSRTVVRYCDFLEERAYGEVGRIIEEGWKFDAVVAANDQMALGAIRSLSEHGLSVPSSVSVTGFDDIPDSLQAIPPLTTIHQPMAELGRQAVRYLSIRFRSGRPEEDVFDLSSAFIVRESCGCVGVTDAVSVEALEQRLREEVSKRVAAEERTALLRRVESAMVRSFSLEDILRELAEGVANLSISCCAVVLFDTKSSTPEWSDLLMLSHGPDVHILTPFGVRFRTLSLLPDGLPDQHLAYVCEPLQFGMEQIGYLLCSADSADRHVYAALRDILSTSMKGASVMSLEKHRENALEEQVKRRTVELSLANRHLKEEITQRKLLERELLENSNDIMTRIGQDIHDDLCQDVAGIGVLAAALENKLDSRHKEAKTIAGELSHAALQAALKAKQISRNLYPADLEENGIVDAVRQLIARDDGDVPVELTVQDGFVVQSREKAFQLYRIIQESLNNAVKHARATAIHVGMFIDHGMITVQVSDDGKGFDSDRAKGQGMGLRILSYRANLIEGKLNIRSSSAGTTVTCRVGQ
ncbi:MAG: substrate-binding domain-containing protein [Sphaerochaetaceae bacterium]